MLHYLLLQTALPATFCASSLMDSQVRGCCLETYDESLYFLTRRIVPAVQSAAPALLCPNLPALCTPPARCAGYITRALLPARDEMRKWRTKINMRRHLVEGYNNHYSAELITDSVIFKCRTWRLQRLE